VHVRRIGHAVQIVGGDRQVLRNLGGAGVTWGTVQISVGILAAKRPTERMLTPSASNHEQPHGFWAFRNASRAEAAARLATSAT
jgi:hypothetical protein